MTLHFTRALRPALLTSALASALLVGCGGGGSSAPDLTSAASSSSGFLTYLASLANGMFDNAEPMDVSGFTLPTDNADTLEPAATSIDAGA